MRFGATLSVAGLSWLEKRFLPAFEKLGSKELALLLTPEFVHLVRAPGSNEKEFNTKRPVSVPLNSHAMLLAAYALWCGRNDSQGMPCALQEILSLRKQAFRQIGASPLPLPQIHDAKIAGGLELHADIAAHELFEPGTLNLVSNAENKVAVHIDPVLLLRVLRGLDALEPETCAPRPPDECPRFTLAQLSTSPRGLTAPPASRPAPPLPQDRPSPRQAGRAGARLPWSPPGSRFPPNLPPLDRPFEFHKLTSRLPRPPELGRRLRPRGDDALPEVHSLRVRGLPSRSSRAGPSLTRTQHFAFVH